MASAAYAAPSAVELPGDVRMMQSAASVVVLAALALLLAAALLWVARRPLFDLASVRVDGDVARNSAATLRANVGARLAGHNFLTLDLQQARAAFESVPWVRHAVVRRVWPNRLAVTLEEHQPVALWAQPDGNDRLVNHLGEVFEANTGDVEDDGLATLQGPEGSAPQMLAMLRRLDGVLQPLQAGEIERLTLSARGSWQVNLDGGAVLNLGRGSEAEVLARTERFVGAMPKVNAAYQRPLASADLRHSDGFAVHLAGLGTAPLTGLAALPKPPAPAVKPPPVAPRRGAARMR